ncbi:hydroxyethylthiazole kinase [Tessaracoccus sp. ZS01]|uniref:hydroxyethylthiazole kinase n=1 Tax=Tessaracoccus sp. ZS01 TaxID=1906324 RepID=UPI00096D63F0|nr:hydroxyethylthiazole kinase [Tessaracoccus sp. ZS01]MCG6568293.1 hydroxyethylthiazole kinase [Tessaracoccus sp. ZS01]OMG53383.1 hydroxyethylthiazole kinase [Tessaracoccus sp. ZS01]
MTGIADVLSAVRATTPLVHCMTNTVVPEITANVLLAVGAAPAMIDLPEEAEIFAGLASALLINVGNGSAEQHAGMRLAAPAAAAAGKPWVLDPVAVGGLPVRTQLARDLLAHRPAAIRANASEVLGLAGTSAGGRGVDATDEVEAAVGTARELNATTGAVVAISGPVDVIVSAGRITRVTGGDALMPLVIGTGCALGATVAACLAVAESEADRHDAVVAAHAIFGAAGIAAARGASAPGTFRTLWLDALHALTPADVEGLVTVEED